MWRLNKIGIIAQTLRFDNRWQLLIDGLVGSRTLTVYRINGIEAVADHRTGDHLGGLRGVLASSEYRSLLSQLSLDNIRSVIDLGAHVGSFPLLLKVLGAPVERVLCVEPNPGSRIKLQFNLQHNRVSADIFAGAISDGGGPAKLYVGKLSTGFSLLPDHPNLGDGLIEVEVATLDMLVDRYFPESTVDICKMDVEGAEFEILLGEHAQSLARCRFLICEIHSVSGYTRSDLIEAIRRKGFVPVPAKGRTDNDTVLFRNEKAGLSVRPSLPAHSH